MKRIILFSILFTALFASGQIFSQSILWKQTNQTLSGNVNIVTHQGNTILAGTIAGFFRSTDDGTTWSLSNSGFSDTKVFAIAVKNDNEIFCGTHAGVYYSSNSGGSWEPRNSGLTDNYINSININTDGTIYTGTLYSGMFISKDNGKTWAQSGAIFDTMSVNPVKVRSTGEIYVGTTSGLFRSDAKGKNYIQDPGDLPKNLNIYSIAIRSNGVVFVGDLYGEVYRSYDNAQHWTKVLDLKVNAMVYSIVVTTNGAILAGTYGQGIWRSNDNGDTWEQINDGLTNIKIMSIIEKTTNTFFTGTWGSGVFRGSDPNISTQVSGTFCAGAELQVGFTTKMSFAADNKFTAQLSDSNGFFMNPVTIGTLSGKDGGTINCVIPKTSLQGSKYHIRVIGSNPSEIGLSNTSDITINALPNMLVNGKITACESDLNQYFVANQPNVSTVWTVTGGTLKSPGVTDTVDIIWGAPGKATIKIIRTNQVTGCNDTSNAAITIVAKPEKPTITRMGQTLVSSANTGNQWYSFGNKLDGKTDKLLDLTEPGLYQVIVTSPNGCVSAISDTFDYNVLYVNEPINMKNIQVYPNPATNKVFVQFSQSAVLDYKIEIINLLGENVYQHDIELNDKLLFEINLENMPNGSYLVKIFDGTIWHIGKLVVKK